MAVHDPFYAGRNAIDRALRGASLKAIDAELGGRDARMKRVRASQRDNLVAIIWACDGVFVGKGARGWDYDRARFIALVDGLLEACWQRRAHPNMWRRFYVYASTWWKSRIKRGRGGGRLVVTPGFLAVLVRLKRGENLLYSDKPQPVAVGREP